MSSPDLGLLVIFGAGASHGAQESVTNALGVTVGRPPLARQLFGQRYDQFVGLHPECGTLVSDLRGLPPEANLEAELDRIQNEDMPTSSSRRGQVAALRYYLRDLLRALEDFEALAPAQSNYHRLVERLTRWQERNGNPIAVVTFNYDALLEKAIRDVRGNPFRDISDYIRDGSFKIFRPHGSVEWARIVTNDGQIDKFKDASGIEDAVIDLARREGLRLADTYSVWPTWNQGVEQGRVVIPALTIPVQRKEDFEMPQEHLALLGNFVANLGWVLVVGWRAGEQHFLNFWQSAERWTQPRLFVANGKAESDQVTTEKLEGIGLRFCEKYAGGSFSQILRDDTLKLLLETPFPGLR